jgi:hypothetical protein
MRCYNHSDRDAVGSCRACSKGLCVECAVDSEYGLSCRGEHEQLVAATGRMVARTVRAQNARGARYIGPAFCGFLGIVFTVYGLLHERTRIFLVVSGVGFIVYSAYNYMVIRKAFGKSDSEA